MVILITWAYDALARKHVAGSTNLKVLTPTQWTGILMLFLALVVSAGADVNGAKHMPDPLAGFAYALLWASSGAAATLSLEIIMTHQRGARTGAGASQSVLLQGLVLYSLTSCCSLLWWICDVTYNDRPKTLFQGWDHRTWWMVLITAATGMTLVSMLKFLGNVWTAVAHIMSIIATVAMADILFSEGWSAYDGIASALLLLATYLLYIREWTSRPWGHKGNLEAAKTVEPSLSKMWDGAQAESDDKSPLVDEASLKRVAGDGS
eukprot:CAMPEP_0114285316 /NCGR_PEP_ID=MMETSP0059-20121206/5115_1 /TAXON_ID=36894 /ORGANISM="Pyramimonas parkeae, Strain CCMP726" /LENGTH=263 /DNA_ID=CAMNT_0001406193 /DNA_START=538 /DNA_END=1329 /DNA_ORIENTATION=-